MVPQFSIPKGEFWEKASSFIECFGFQFSFEMYPFHALRSYQSYRDIERSYYIDSTCTYIYTHIYRWVLYSNFIAQHSKSQLNHMIIFEFYMYIFSKSFFPIKKPLILGVSPPPNNPPFTHVLRLGDWRRQPWRILWEKRVMDTSIHIFGSLYGCRYHFFIEWFMDVIMVMLFWLNIIGFM